MRLTLRTLLNLLLLVGLLLALGIAIYSFIQSNRYKHEKETFLKQEYLSRLHFSETLKRIIEFQEKIQEIKSGNRDKFDLFRYLSSLDMKIKNNLTLVDNFFSVEDQNKLKYIHNDINHIIDNLKNNKNNISLEDIVLKVEKYIYDLSYILSNSLSQQRNDINKIIEMDTIPYMFILISSLLIVGILIAVFFALQFQKRSTAEERKQYFSSFSSLFAHATISRVCGLKLFLGDLNDHYKLPSKEDVKMALQAITEIETVTADLLDVTDPQPRLGCEPLETLLHEVIDHSKRPKELVITLDLTPEGAGLSVPVAELRLMLDELIQNAVESVKNVNKPKIIIRAHLQNHWLSRAKKLILEIIDNGTGMDQQRSKQAIAPHFSKKGASHQGLGLTNCAGLISSLKGKMKINSIEKKGTRIWVELPVKG